MEENIERKNNETVFTTEHKCIFCNDNPRYSNHLWCQYCLYDNWKEVKRYIIEDMS